MTSIDALRPDAALRTMLDAQTDAARAVGNALPGIEEAAHRMADTLRNGGTVVYAAAGSSGLMALADACELPGTYGIDPAQVRIVMAGGIPTDARMPGHTEDDTSEAETVAAAMSPGDLLIAISASGTTPQALAMTRAAQTRGIATVGVANMPGSPLLTLADTAIAVPTPPEVVEGSTRLGAGTAQKIALNMISTLAGVLLGHVHDGMMVNLRPDNIKLRARAETIVARIAAVPADAARAALEATGYNVKPAVLVALGHDPEDARRILDASGQVLRQALQAETPKTRRA
ncbi:N-acetylmuramic acid 6-phosphate etherase [Sagittula sp. MA-2]|jgi:N-acetylmuramic acid 6-phosphate etherase|uniref:N-acetylmuramic acid 6-phosphate etherase n=1 Tax=Sagittula sp. MA-2 TaxID=3048007 RepID=UPI0024C420BE|nr:N-acetylmuramic acid 6-phosphate etherase [Sagittula sp. MA-2]WHZ37831.1 N-acetylmuramic acid 6-phosphate etherase [Sagittula sp. MA-2]